MGGSPTDEPVELGLGLDLGAVNVRAALWDAGRRSGPVWVGARPVQGQLLRAARLLLGELAGNGVPPGRQVTVRVTGVGQRLLGDRLGYGVNEIVALAEAARALCPNARSLLEIGGHSSRWVHLEGGAVADFALSEPCAAGTGAFIEQQAARLRLDAAGLSQAALAAERGVPVAGRCSVFAKSDMIHLQQKGVAVEEIAYGLCLAVARNVVSSLLRGRRMPTPAALVGGTSANAGLCRALGEVVGPVEVPPWAPFFPAVGAALLALAEPEEALALDQLLRWVRGAERDQRQRAGGVRLPRLAQPAASAPVKAEPRFDAAERGAVEAYLGVDVGSVSTNLVVLRADGEQVLDGVYLPTRGRPVEALREGLEQLAGRFGGSLVVLGLGTTGSGRHLAAGLLGADVVQNEISCQLTSALHYVPEADTVIEIGGQDSKFIRASEGRLVDFAMNKICAAGTGSFLEEEALRLGVAIENQFAALALDGERPRNLGCRCTVFMDTEVVEALAQETSVPNLCAGLAYAIARNYLEKVVERRPIGDHVVMQGGVASNQAVVAAFSSLLERPIHVHPLGRVSGAIGAALAARRRRIEQPYDSGFLGLQALEGGGGPRVEAFECARCENRCQVSRITVARDGDKKRAHFGDACERYSAQDSRRAASSELPDLFADRERLMEPAMPRPAHPRAVIGLPRASLLLGQLPFWGTLLGELGFAVRLSRRSSPAALARGAASLSAETCLPVKLAFGHVQELLEDDKDDPVDAVLLPALREVTNWQGETGILCPFTDSLPHMVRASLGGGRLLVPELDLAERELGVELARVLAPFGVRPEEVQRALVVAMAVQRGALARLRLRGAEVLAESPAPRLAILGRPYHLADPYLSLNLPRHLHRLGIVALPMDALPVAADDWDLGPVPWRFSRDTLRALRWVRGQRDLYPVLVSSFGCGPDAFSTKHLRRVLGDKPCLELEFDEHRAEAGLITRLEAFLDEIHDHTEQAVAARPPEMKRPAPKKRRHYRGRRLWIPFMCDHAHAFAGAFRFAGVEARVLPPPDEELQARAEAIGSGKECHPYAVLAADLERVIERHRPGDLFYIAGSTLPCLIQQYNKGMGLFLEERGVRDIELLSPTMADYWDLLGVEGLFRLHCGLFAVDLLIRASCAIRPYERSPGLTDALHARNLHDLEQALAGGEIGPALERCAARLAAVERVAGGPPRPLVGVAGDVYTRINPAANHNLFAQLEAAGCEVWPAPFLVDLVEYGLVNGMREALQQRRVRRLLNQAFMLAAQQTGNWLVRRGLGSPRALQLWWQDTWRSMQEPWREEPPFDAFCALARPYVGEQGNELVRWNVAKMVDFARRGAHGIINAVSQSCMVGTVSAALARRIREDHGGVPLVTLIYGATPTDALRSSLEAFVHQVKRWHADAAAAAGGDVRHAPAPGAPEAPNLTSRGGAAMINREPEQSSRP